MQGGKAGGDGYQPYPSLEDSKEPTQTDQDQTPCEKQAQAPESEMEIPEGWVV